MIFVYYDNRAGPTELLMVKSLPTLKFFRDDISGQMLRNKGINCLDTRVLKSDDTDSEIAFILSMTWVFKHELGVDLKDGPTAPKD